MVIDRQGRAYIGDFGFDLNSGAPPRPTHLIAIDPDGSARIEAEDLWFPNGMAITADGGTLIAAETFAGRLTAFDIQADGSLSHRRVFARLDGIYADGEAACRPSNVIPEEPAQRPPNVPFAGLRSCTLNDGRDPAPGRGVPAGIRLHSNDREVHVGSLITGGT